MVAGTVAVRYRFSFDTLARKSRAVRFEDAASVLARRVLPGAGKGGQEALRVG
jgi:hypothetical protein